jgi:hypothetical protein
MGVSSSMMASTTVLLLFFSLSLSLLLINKHLFFTLVSGSPCSAGVKSCAAGAGDANLRKGDEDSDVVAGRAANERVKAAADVAEGSTLSATADAAPRLEAARARRSIALFSLGAGGREER